MKGIIYRILCNITGEVYIGSTVKTLKRRISYHKGKYSNTTCSKKIIERGDYIYETIVEVEVNDKRELHRIETDYIKTTANCINRIVSFRSADGYGDKQKEYYQKQPVINCVCGGHYKSGKARRRMHLATKKHQTYIESNPAAIV